MLTDKYILSSVSINNNSVYVNGYTIFKSGSTDISGFLLSVYQHFQLSYPKFYKMDNLSKLGWLTSELLLNKFSKDDYQPEDIGIVLANASSSLDNDLKYIGTIKDIPSPSVFVYTLPNIVIGEICIRNNFKGEHAFFVQDKFNPDFIYQQVDYLLDNNILQAAVCGWVEILEQDYKAVLYLVEKKKSEQSILFSAENMNNIFLQG